ncbi:hypothetical protein [Dokdonia pacifica]|uniref:Uncharacterized protein n=1 Tax=Dokdonia pacifica TaxID=1627892 RepID=A0A239AV62_9FLAO|nr:hypothetical protein [Dokdonia pacifica]SNR99202.1 hypothetical protein SAMN06265376_105140 [Dokdonia pacifica]
MRYQLIISYAVICITLIIIVGFPSHHIVNTGAITFKNMNASKDAFTIKTQSILPPNTRIFFTDTEWNGSHFGIDEHTLLWNSGKDSIPIGSIIHFKSLKSHTIPSIGHAKGILKIASKKEAIFAYQGTERMPTHFIAGIAYQLSDYGTLDHTGLIIDSTAVVLH